MNEATRDQNEKEATSEQNLKVATSDQNKKEATNDQIIKVATSDQIEKEGTSDQSEQEATSDQKDLPLMSNTDSVTAHHYSISLICDIDKKTLSGKVEIKLSLRQKCQEIILDCCDIKIFQVYLQSHQNNQELQPLEFSQSEWAVFIKYPPTESIEERSDQVVEIHYSTLPNTRSLHWRLDNDGHICAYTPASAINNRGLVPCQDVPGSMSTWNFSLSLPATSACQVFTTGDSDYEIESSESHITYKYATQMLLPMSTFALAIGNYAVVDLQSVGDSGIPVRLIGCPSDLGGVTPTMKQYIVASLQAATNILGPYPLPKVDIVIVSQYFSGLGLASPNLMLLSPTVFLGDLSFLVKISHEICHSWFGILVGAKDWSEVWLSEGFATFLEDFVHEEALKLIGIHTNPELMKMRAYVKYKTLCSEVENFDQDLQKLRPMKGEKLLDEHEIMFVKHGLNAEAGLAQSHYLKGFFLLHYLMEFVGQQIFLYLIKKYFWKYKGELVDSTCFIAMFFQEYQTVAVNESSDSIIQTWLNSADLPSTLSTIVKVHKCEDIVTFKQVITAKDEILQLSQEHRTNKHPVLTTDLVWTEQVLIMLELILQEKVPAKVMKVLRAKYETFIQTNPDIFHVWCELVINNKSKQFYQDLKTFLLNHQSMGVYLYSEMLGSRSSVLSKIAAQVISEVEVNLDPNMKSVLLQYQQESQN